MKKLFIIGNWKSNKTSQEARAWAEGFSHVFKKQEDKEVIVCPSFSVLPTFHYFVLSAKMQIVIGAQDVSPYDEGSYTGEVNAKQIKETAVYVLIGHSERRKYFSETNDMVNKKIKNAVDGGLIPIVCVSEVGQVQKDWSVFQEKLLIAYEPLFAIGSGNADTPENANAIAKQIKEIVRVPILYGGSVTEKNVASFTKMGDIDGVLVGKASLDPHTFASLIINA